LVSASASVSDFLFGLVLDLVLDFVLPPVLASPPGTRAIAEVAYQRGELSPLVPMEIFRYLTFNFDNEGRYLLFNAIANQLRYPNNHTYYFSCVLLFLFAEAPQEIIQEQITRYGR
jgi:hypothetical protein